MLRFNVIKLTKLSSLFATIDANRRSPARSEMRKMYSGALTWLLRWVRPAIPTNQPLQGMLLQELYLSKCAGCKTNELSINLHHHKNNYLSFWSFYHFILWLISFQLCTWYVMLLSKWSLETDSKTVTHQTAGLLDRHSRATLAWCGPCVSGCGHAGHSAERFRWKQPQRWLPHPSHHPWTSASLHTLFQVLNTLTQ